VRKGLPLIGACATVTLAWAALYVQRGAAHAPNVDDYLYANASTGLAGALKLGPHAFASAILHTGQTAPLVPTLATVGSRVAGVQGGVATELLFLLLLTVSVYSFARLRLPQVPSAWIAAAASLNQAVLGWSVMLNFALAASALSACAFVAYLRSDRMRRWPWALGTGLALGLLSISRSIAPVYVAPMVALLVIDFGWHHRTGFRTAPWAQVGASVTMAAIVAAPWWVVSGPTALHYLRTAGYSASSGFAGAGGVLVSPSALLERTGHTLADLGNVQAVWLAAFTVAAAAVAIRQRRADFTLICAWVIVVLLILATSPNAGTGFGLPLIVMSIVVIGVLLAPVAPRRLLAATTAALLAFGFVAEVYGNSSEWLSGAPYREMAAQATGTSLVPNIDSIHESVLSAIGVQPTLLARDDDVLNAFGLGWFAAQDGVNLQLSVPDYGPSGLATAEHDLTTTHFLILGDTPAPYHADLSIPALGSAAVARGFHLIRSWRISDQNTIELWQHP
jgi:hypothetical protein